MVKSEVVALAVEEAMMNALLPGYVSPLLSEIATLPKGVVVPMPMLPAIRVPLLSLDVPLPTASLPADSLERPRSTERVSPVVPVIELKAYIKPPAMTNALGPPVGIRAAFAFTLKLAPLPPQANPLPGFPNTT